MSINVNLFNLQEENHYLNTKIKVLEARVEKLIKALEIDHDHLYPEGKCAQCDVLREDYETYDKKTEMADS